MSAPIDRPYQTALNAAIDAQHAAGARAVLARLPTGGGKTICMSRQFQKHRGASIAIAHRQELVGQISLALARNAIRHRIVGAHSLASNCTALHMAELGRSFCDPGAWVGVAGVDTLIRRTVADDRWLQQVTLWQTDEAHHLLRDNKWGDAVAMFPNALGIGWTATPGRADGKGLGRPTAQDADGRWDNDGVFDAMVSGPEMRELIDAGYLTDYKILCPPSDIDLSSVTVTGTGDFSPPKLRAAVHASHIVGDVVGTYLKHAAGKLGLTFAVDVEHAEEMTRAYRAAGVAAEVVTAKTPDVLRASILRRFRSREVLQLVNVDLFGEGFDVPACEVVSMARPTASFNLYAQQFGRALRPSPGKTHGLIIDHVNNVLLRHGLPDAPRMWSLDRRERRGKSESVIGVRYCPKCTAAFERVKWRCPYCGHEPEPAGRDAPAQVDGDLTELDAATLKALRGELARVDGAVRIPERLTGPAAGAVAKHHNERQRAQAGLRALIQLWAGWRRDAGDDDRTIYRRFYLAWGVDVLTAQTLGASEANALNARLAAALQAAGVAVL